MRRILTFAAATILASGAVAAPASKTGPDCSGTDRYPVMITHTELVDEGILPRDGVDWRHIINRMIASQQISKHLWRQVFHVTYPLKSGRKVEAIVVNNASYEECSEGGTQIFVVSKSSEP